MQPHKIWIEHCKAAKGIEDEFGTEKRWPNNDGHLFG